MKRTLLLSFIFLFGLVSNIFSQETATIKSQVTYLENGTIKITLTAEIASGWYMYGATPITDGPMPASFDITPTADFKLIGKFSEETPAKKKFDESFGLEVGIFENKAVFYQIIQPLKKNNFVIKGTLNYQTCNGAECLIGENEISVNIKGESIKAPVTPVETVTTTDTNGAETIVSEDTVSTVAPLTTVSEEMPAAKKSEQSLLIFLLIAFTAGLGSILTPCVFPMIPMTVGFLVSGGSKKNGIIRGLVFGLSVMLIYSLLGLIVALFQSTTTTDVLGTHWIPNILFALLFLVFAISFFGAFEITLPSGLANKADQKADKGGIIAAFFVAFAMVIVSFSCTGPFVGSILAAAVSDGVALKPILGMAVFGFAFAFPFVIFSFFPAIMKKLPKSGGWLNMVKVIFAFVLLGFSIKYFYNVDAYFGLGIITRVGFLSIWIVIAILLGLYFLGKIRTHHDEETTSLGWGRIMAAIASFAFAVYLITGLFGAPLKSISGLVPPQDGSTIVLSGGNEGKNETSASPLTYSSLPSVPSIDEALVLAQKENKPIFLYFKSHTCSVCKSMEASVLNNPEVLSLLKTKFIIANLYVDDKTPDEQEKTLGRRLRKYQTEKFGSVSQPLYAIISPEEEILSGAIGSCSLEEFIGFLNK